MAQRASLLMGPFMRPPMTHEGRLIAGNKIHGAVAAVGKRQHCGAVGTHARLRAGVAEAPLRAAAPLVSSATLPRNASMRLTTRCGGAKVLLRSGTVPACLAFRCASRASS